jgi:Lrp/AsnC family leucine-responsive transcriptional regulator
LLDATDIKILAILQEHARHHLAEIAKEVELSPPAVMERVKKLESRGIIKGYHAILDAKKLGKDITAFVGVSISQQCYIESFSSHMREHTDVLECHHVTGDESFILKVKTANTVSLEKLLAEIRSMEGVTRTVTKVVLSTSKENQTLCLEDSLEGLSEQGRGPGNGDEKKALTATLRKR